MKDTLKEVTRHLKKLKKKIDVIELVGEASRIPFVKSLVENFEDFGGLEA